MEQKRIEIGETKVTLKTVTPLENVAFAAKVCYANDPSKINVDREETERMISMLIDIGHESPLEHTMLTFFLENVSRSLTHQLVRHRIASYSQRSQRYVNESEFCVVIPADVIEMGEEVVEAFLAAAESSRQHYLKLREVMFKAKFGEGPCDVPEIIYKKVSKQVNENAREALMNMTASSIVATMNARAFMNFCEERLCLKAQRPIREVAEEMKRQADESELGFITKKFGPKCIRLGYCPENDGCGLMPSREQKG